VLPLINYGLNNPGIQNNTRGTIRIQRGTGAFDGISAESKVVSVLPGDRLDGTLSLRVLNGGARRRRRASDWHAFLGRPEEFVLNCRGMGQRRTDTYAPIHLVAPVQTGTYYILFAMQLELSGANVASGTNWALHHDTWGDGNDISQFTAGQISQAQKHGCAAGQWLGENGYHSVLIAADAVAVQVK
jgi:hypothetical protein